MFKGKSTRVILAGRAKYVYKDLSSSVLNSVKQKIELLKGNPQYGAHIQKRKIPAEYIMEYGVNNLWKINISGAWRMIYTIKGSEAEIIALILDILSHKEYDKKFGYKSNN